jgi:hypothetical protein
MGQFAMKVSIAILCFVSLASSTVTASRKTDDSDVLVARGVLSRNGKAGILWIQLVIVHRSVDIAFADRETRRSLC